MDFITEQIAIGNRHEAADLELLLASRINAVLNLAYDLDVSYIRAEAPHDYRYQIEYHKVGLIDGPGNHPTALIAAVYTLDALLQRNRTVLVHCHAGVSRSSTVVAVYLAHKNSLGFDEALAQVRQKRWQVNPNPALAAIAKSLPNLFKVFDTGNYDAEIQF
jgi:protein-tyrosine phosphatase